MAYICNQSSRHITCVLTFVNHLVFVLMNKIILKNLPRQAHLLTSSSNSSGEKKNGIILDKKSGNLKLYKGNRQKHLTHIA